MAMLSGVTLLLAGCATLSPDGGIGLIQMSASADLSKNVEKISSEEQAASVKLRADALLKQALTADAAVQIALWNNRGLQAAFNELGIADAQRLQASLPPNPRVSIARTTAPLALEIERQITGSIFALATLPARTEIANEKFRGAQLRATEAVLKLAAETRRQYYRAVAANSQVATLGQAKATAELFKRLGESGGVNKLNQARDFVFYAETGAQLAQAKIQQRVEREKLIRLLGLWGMDLTVLKLPGALPALPRLASIREVEAEALKRRVDLQMARADLDMLAKSLGLAQATRFVTDIDLLGRRTYDRAFVDNGGGGLDRERTIKRTLELEIEIPLFDFGQAKVARAEETYMQAANRLAEKAVNIRSEAREAYQVWRGTHDVTRLYQGQILPLRKIIQDESLLQYNGMLIDVTQLIADSRGRLMSQLAAINAKRDFWIADTDFKHALIGGGTSGGAASGGGAAPQAGGEAGH